MYANATDCMTIPSGDIVFADDDPEKMKGASVAGLRGALMVRSGPPPVGNLPWIKKLGRTRGRLLTTLFGSLESLKVNL